MRYDFNVLKSQIKLRQINSLLTLQRLFSEKLSFSKRTHLVSKIEVAGGIVLKVFRYYILIEESNEICSMS